MRRAPVNFAGLLVIGAPDDARRLLDGLRSWGMSRLSLSWALPQIRLLVERLESWGHELNIYAVDCLASFLQAVFLLPRSVTADFDFPQWNLHGTGSGARHPGRALPLPSAG